MNADQYEQDETLAQLRKDRNYTYQDSVTVSPELDDYEKKVDRIVTETYK